MLFVAGLQHLAHHINCLVSLVGFAEVVTFRRRRLFLLLSRLGLFRLLLRFGKRLWLLLLFRLRSCRLLRLSLLRSVELFALLIDRGVSHVGSALILLVLFWRLLLLLLRLLSLGLFGFNCRGCLRCLGRLESLGSLWCSGRFRFLRRLASRHWLLLRISFSLSDRFRLILRLRLCGLQAMLVDSRVGDVSCAGVTLSWLRTFLS